MNDDFFLLRALRGAGQRVPLARVLLFDCNPFYLLSAMCMLFGLFSLNNSLTWSPLPEHNLLWLILILNVYEILLVALGIFLARRGAMRDANTLFVLEAFFLVDAGFLNSEIFNFDFAIGLGVNLALFVLAVAKVAAIFRGLGLRLSDPRYLLIQIQMLLLLATPGLFKQLTENDRAALSPLAIYGVWWIVGLIPILYLLLLRHPSSYRHRAVIGTFVLLPIVSILAHLCTSNWVYHVRWYSANLSPLLLGLATAIGASDHHVRNLALRLRLHLCLPVLAILLASSNPMALVLFTDNLVLSPMRLVLLAATVVYLHGLLVHHHPYFGVAGALCVGASVLGDSPATMTSNVTTISRTATSTVWRLMPRTVGQWGIVSIVSSYVLLGIGLLLSLFRHNSKEMEESE
jgi:hypothetical protein